MKRFSTSNNFFMHTTLSISLLFITRETASGLIEDLAKNEYDQVEVPVDARNFSLRMPKPSPAPLIVELSIICDKEFGDLFKHNLTKILNYWKVYTRDVNNRFKSLTKTNITFHISSIRVSRHADWQPIERAREGGKINLAKFLSEFSEWVYVQWNSGWHVGYDVAVGVTGLSFTGIESGYSYHNGSCNFNRKDLKVYSTAVLTDKGDFRVGTLSHELAHILGARHDYDCEDKPRYHIMDYSNWRGLRSQFKFSECTDQDINNFLRYPTTSSCLKVRNSDTIIYRPNEDTEVDPPNMEEQCQWLFGNEATILVTPESSERICQRVECGLRTANGGIEFVKTYTPVDNSRCSRNGVCLQGVCRPSSGSEMDSISTVPRKTSMTDTSIQNNTTSISISTNMTTSFTRLSSTLKSVVCEFLKQGDTMNTSNSTNSSAYRLRNIYVICCINILFLVNIEWIGFLLN